MQFSISFRWTNRITMKKIENAENHEINERLFIKWFLICYISIFIFFSCLLFFANFHLSSSSVVTLIRWTTNKVSLACAVGASFSSIWGSNWEHVSTGEWFVFSRFRQDENGDSQRMTSAPTWYYLHLEFSKNNKRRNSFNIWGITKPHQNPKCAERWADGDTSLDDWHSM